MKKICGIYKITNPKGRVYVGQSVNIHDRYRHYKCLNCKEQAKLYNSIKKYGWAAHVFEIIHQCQKEELNGLEEMYVLKFDCVISGLNLKYGGGSRSKLSEETKRKISKAGTGRVHSAESKIKMSLAQMGKTLSIETRKKISNANRIPSDKEMEFFNEADKDKYKEKRKRLSEAQKNRKAHLIVYTDEMRKISSARTKQWYIDNPEKAKLKTEKSIKFFKENNPNIGTKNTPETKQKRIRSNREFYEENAPRVIQYDKNNKAIRTFLNLVEASLLTGVSKSEITNCCNKVNRVEKGGRKRTSVTAGGFYWSYSGEESSIVNKVVGRGDKRKYIYQK